jgi:hypothetical protein
MSVSVPVVSFAVAATGEPAVFAFALMAVAFRLSLFLCAFISESCLAASRACSFLPGEEVYIQTKSMIPIKNKPMYEFLSEPTKII